MFLERLSGGRVTKESRNVFAYGLLLGICFMFLAGALFVMKPGYFKLVSVPHEASVVDSIEVAP